MHLSGASWQLDNGLAVKAISDPAADSASRWCALRRAVFRRRAWPGLAHLLEHMLFAAANFSAQEGLMSWVRRSLADNATTQLQTAFFFEVGTEHLARGSAKRYARAPQLASEAIEQEIEVIAPNTASESRGRKLTKRERKMFGGLGAMHRFHIGSGAFGNDISAFSKDAAASFTSAIFVAPNMTLWLQGTQCAQLHLHSATAALPSAAPYRTKPHRVTAAKDYTLSLPGTPQLRLVFALSRSHSRGWLRRLERLLLDEAPGGLLRGCASGVVPFGWIIRAAVRHPAEFYLYVNHGSASEAAHIESPAGVATALQVLTTFSVRITSGWQIAISTVWRRSISCGPERLATAGGVERRLAAAYRADLGAAVACRALMATAKPVKFKGCVAWPLRQRRADVCQEPFRFLPPRRRCLVRPCFRPGAAAASAPRRSSLCCSPGPSSRFSDGHLRLTGCAPGRQNWRIGRDILSFEAHQGLLLQLAGSHVRVAAELAGSHALICHGLSEVNRALRCCRRPFSAKRRETCAIRSKEQSDIAIRRLLAQLPALSAPTEAAQWHATLIGGDGELKRHVSHLLYDFPYFVPGAAAADTSTSLPHHADGKRRRKCLTAVLPAAKR
uniref:PqqF n=1 Tax=Serratia marcescens TaxID=615 RepID=Q0GFB2_SERMA|nr:PqqF [Serratia marcescens]